MIIALVAASLFMFYLTVLFFRGTKDNSKNDKLILDKRYDEWKS